MFIYFIKKIIAAVSCSPGVKRLPAWCGAWRGACVMVVVMCVMCGGGYKLKGITIFITLLTLQIEA